MKHKPLDKAGIWLGILCAIHCLFVPVMLPMLSVIGLSFMGFELFERIILSISMLIGGIAMSIAIRHHHSPVPLLMLVTGGVLYFNKHAFSHGIEIALIFLAASLIVGAHVLNLHLCRVRPVADCDVADDAASESLADAALSNTVSSRSAP